MPQHLILQFDNCSENKVSFFVIQILMCYFKVFQSQNKYVFGYVIQKKYFRKVEIFFLIVGHTHESIDQYFSVLSRQILQTNFIGSPLSLASLLSRDGISSCNLTGNAWDIEKEKKRDAAPLIVRKIFSYDMRTIASIVCL